MADDVHSAEEEGRSVPVMPGSDLYEFNESLGEGAEPDYGAEDTEGVPQEHDGAGEGDGSEADEGGALLGADAGGSAADGGASAGGGGEDALDPGHIGSVDVSAYLGGDIPVHESAYEGVSAEDFQAFALAVDSRLAALDAMGAVVVFALFMCAGSLAVRTLVRSMEEF